MGATLGNGSPVMLAMGHSVIWGQGLQEWNKFDRLVCDQLKYRPEYAGLTLVRLAHSGAIIGADKDQTGRAAPGEVPWHFPTVIQQCEGYDGDPDAVRVVLLDGGINDVSLQVILNPQTTPGELGDLLQRYCDQAMVELLKSVAAKFSNPACRIIVTGYYQILSAASSFAPTVAFLELLGITEASTLLNTATGFSDLVALSHLFWQGSDTALKKAVEDVNRTFDNRITFVGRDSRNKILYSRTIPFSGYLLAHLRSLTPLTTLETFERESVRTFIRTVRSIVTNVGSLLSDIQQPAGR
jgi:hypothetical protein